MMKYMEVAGDIVKRVEEALQTYLSELPTHKTLREPMQYAVNGGGKRLRPVLLLECFSLFRSDLEYAMPYAIALELIHSYSLVHDDLPCMDDDETRRGKPTVHVAFDEGIAVLTGDALLNAGLSLSIDTAVKNQDIQSLQASAVLSTAAGPNGMLYGQIMDLYDDIGDLTKLNTLYDKKTGCLIRAAAEIGAILGRATEAESDSLARFSGHLATAFQIQDDILDLEQDREEDNMSILRYLSVQEATEDMKRHSDYALRALTELQDRDTAKLEKITLSLIQREL